VGQGAKEIPEPLQGRHLFGEGVSPSPSSIHRK
jgi:hypothetical protein